jgi:nucleotide-binding universal stress UspA family protein
VDISTDLPAGPPAAELIDASHDAALLVVGHRGLGGFTGLLVGSVGVQTAAHAACPVIIVRDGHPDEADDRGQAGPVASPVVIGVDGSDLSSLAVDFAFAHAALHGLGVTAVNVYQRPAFTAPSDAWLAAYDVDGGTLTSATCSIQPRITAARRSTPSATRLLGPFFAVGQSPRAGLRSVA